MLDPARAMRCSDEQVLLAETAAAFCRDHGSSAAVRHAIASEAGFDRALWDEMVGLGWSGIVVPERFGGSALTLAEVAVVAEAMGRHLLAAPFVGTQLFVQGLLAGGDEAQQAAWLPRVCRGAIGTVALFEPSGDWDLSHAQCRAVAADGGFLLGGVKSLVDDAASADAMLVSVALDGAPALAIVPAGRVGAARRRRETVIDETRRSFELDLDGLAVDAASLITGDAARRALAALQRAALLLCAAEAAGGLAGVLELTVGYLNLRTAFGRKIGSYQALKHACADMLVGLERSRSHVAHAASLLAAGDDARVALHMAKAEAGDGFVFAGDRAVQFHGGTGFTWDCDAQLYLRRALWLQYAWGDAAHHRRRLERLLLDGDAAAG